MAAHVQELVSNPSTPRFAPLSTLRPARQMRRKTVVVGWGHKARQGKDTCVNHLVAKYADTSLDVRKYSFAAELKIELYDWWRFFHLAFNDAGIVPPLAVPDRSTSPLNWFEQHRPELRVLAQLYGTEFRRAQDSSYWTKKVTERIEIERPDVALISDMRFANEAEICDVTVNVKCIGGEVVTSNHASETELDSWPYTEVVEAKYGDVETLCRLAENVLDKILTERRMNVTKATRIS